MARLKKAAPAAKKPTRTPATGTAPRKPGSGFAPPPKPSGHPFQPGGGPPIGPDGFPLPPMDANGFPLSPPTMPAKDPNDQTSLLVNPPPSAENAPRKVTGNAFSQVGSHGLYVSGGLVHDEILRELQGVQGFARYRELAENSAVAGACLLAIETLIRKATWCVEPGDGSTEEEFRAQAINSMINDMSQTWPDTISEILQMLIYGFSYMEIVYKIRRGPTETNPKFRSEYEDGLIAWRKWVGIPQETLYQWVFDDDGSVSAMQQLPPSDSVNGVRTIPIEKSLLFRTKAIKNNPQGKSLLRSAYFPWRWVKRIMEHEGIGVERDLTGLPYAGVPPEILDPNATQADKTQLEYIKKTVTHVRQNSLAGVVFPLAYDSDTKQPLYEFKLLSTGGMKQFDTGKIIERYERRIAMAMLADFVMLGHEHVGSLALSKDKVSLAGRMLAAVLDSIASVVNRYAIPRLYLLNGWRSVAKCKLVPGDIENADIKNMGVYVRNLMSVGALTPDPKLEAALREFAGLPKQDPAYLVGPPVTNTVQPDDMPDDGPDPAADGAPDDGGDGSSTSDRPGKPDSSRPAKPAPSFPGLPRKLRPNAATQKSVDDVEAAIASLSKTLEDRLSELRTQVAGVARGDTFVEVKQADAAKVEIKNTVEVPPQPPAQVNVENTIQMPDPEPAPSYQVTKELEHNDRGLVTKVVETHTPVVDEDDQAA